MAVIGLLSLWLRLMSEFHDLDFPAAVLTGCGLTQVRISQVTQILANDLGAIWKAVFVHVSEKNCMRQIVRLLFPADQGQRSVEVDRKTWA